MLVNGIEIALWEWPGEGPPVLFCHATGFHARIWDQVIAASSRRRRCFAFDARGHGRSSKPAPPYAWRDFGADAAAVAECLGLSGAMGVGHSHGRPCGDAGRGASAGCILGAAAARSRDPRRKISTSDPGSRPSSSPSGATNGHRPQEMFESFENRPPFDAWDRRVLRDYCEYGLSRGTATALHSRVPARHRSLHL